MGRTMVQHVRFKTVYISLSSSAKHLREITKICEVCKRKLRRQIILISILNSKLSNKYVMLRERERAYHNCLGRGGRQTVVTEGGV